MAAFSVYVESDGSPQEGVKVHASFPGLIGSTWLEEFTDDSGHAYFEADRHEVVLAVRGEDYGPYEFEDGDSFTISLD